MYDIFESYRPSSMSIKNEEIKALRADLEKAQKIALYLGACWDAIEVPLYDELGEEKQESIRQWLLENA